MVLVDDEIPGGEIGEGAELLPVGGGLFGPGLPPGLAEQLPLRQNGQLHRGVLHAVGQYPLGQIDPPGRGQVFGREGHGDPDLPAAEVLLQNLRPAAAAAEHQGPVSAFLELPQVGGGHLQVAGVGGQLPAAEL